MPLSTLDILLLDGEYPMIGNWPLQLPPGYWGIVVTIEDETHYYYVSEEIKQWHLYFFGAQLGILQ